jgi:hypothetical protein
MFVAIDHEELIGVIGQLVAPAQVAQHDLDGDVLTHADHVEVHQRTHRVLGIGHGGTQLLALLHRERGEHPVEHFGRQIGRKVGKLVGIELFGRSDQFLDIHVLDERFAHGVGDFEQDLAVALRLHQVPHRQALITRQGLENVGDVRGMHAIEQLLQLRQVLAVDQRLHQIVARAVLALHQVLDQLVTMQQLEHLLELRCDAGTVFLLLGHL